MGTFVVLEDAEERYAPPEQPVLRIDVIGSNTYLTIADVVEDNKQSTLVTKAAVCVDTEKLANAWTILMAEEIRRNQ